MEKYDLEKIRTIGDSYMVASGVPRTRPDHAQALARMALDMQAFIRHDPMIASQGLDFRIGMSSGPVVAGVIGRKKFAYDLWGDAVVIRPVEWNRTACLERSKSVARRLSCSRTTSYVSRAARSWSRAKVQCKRGSCLGHGTPWAPSVWTVTPVSLSRLTSIYAVARPGRLERLPNGNGPTWMPRLLTRLVRQNRCPMSRFPTPVDRCISWRRLEENSMATIRYMVNDVPLSIEFYVNRLGFQLIEQMGPVFAVIARGDLRLWLSGPQTSAARPMPDGRKPEAGGWNRFVVEVEDIESFVASLKNAGVSFRNEIITGPGGRQILAEDPSGNPIEIFQPA